MGGGTGARALVVGRLGLRRLGTGRLALGRLSLRRLGARRLRPRCLQLMPVSCTPGAQPVAERHGDERDGRTGDEQAKGSCRASKASLGGQGLSQARATTGPDDLSRWTVSPDRRGDGRAQAPQRGFSVGMESGAGFLDRAISVRLAATRSLRTRIQRSRPHRGCPAAGGETGRLANREGGPGCEPFQYP